MTVSYCLLSLKKSHVSHHIIFITTCAQNACLQHERARRRWRHWPTAHSITVWVCDRAVHSLLMRRFSWSWYDRLLKHTPRCVVTIINRGLLRSGEYRRP